MSDEFDLHASKFEAYIRNRIQNRCGLEEVFIEWQEWRKHTHAATPAGSFPEQLCSVVNTRLEIYERLFLSESRWRDLDPDLAPQSWQSKVKEFKDSMEKRLQRVFQVAENRLTFAAGHGDDLQKPETAAHHFYELLREFDPTYYTYSQEVDIKSIRSRKQCDLARAMWAYSQELSRRYVALLRCIPETEPDLERGLAFRQEVDRLSRTVNAAKKRGSDLPAAVAKAVRTELAPEFTKIHRKLPAVEKQKKIHNKRVKRLREVGRANKGKRRVSVVKIRQTFKELLPSHNAKRTAAKVATATKLSISVSTVERGLRRRKSPA